MHWALYRAPLILLIGDAMLGAIAGIVLIVIEWVVRGMLTHRPMHREHALVLVLCLLTSAFLYVTTRNLWLMIAADIAIRVVTATTVPQPGASSR